MASCEATIELLDPVALARIEQDRRHALTLDDIPVLCIHCSLLPRHDGRHQAYYGAGLFEWPQPDFTAPDRGVTGA